jgi:hypothetical protein
MAKSFKGIAYFSGTGLNAEWAHLATELLAPITGAGGSVMFDGQTDGVLRIAFGDSAVTVSMVGGRAQGVIKEMPKAGALIACLVAVRRSLGRLNIVDDEQNDIPARVRQSYRCYSADWIAVQAVAERLGLVASNNFMQQNAALLGKLI